MEEEKSVYRKKAEAKLKEWQAELDKLKAKAEYEEADKSNQLKKDIERIRAKRNELRSRAEAIKSSSGNAWEELKKGVDKAIVELESAVNKAKKPYN